MKERRREEREKREREGEKERRRDGERGERRTRMWGLGRGAIGMR